MAEDAIFLVNLGSPDSPSVPDVRRYLRQFLMDPYVIDVPAPVRALILHAFILPFRPKQSAEAYRQIWWSEGSPLIVISEQVRALLAGVLDRPVGLGMRYGNPSIEQGIADLLAQAPAARRLICVPLYPHHAMSSVTTVEVEVRKALKRLHANVELVFVQPFYEDPEYITALAKSVEEALAPGYDHLLLSYHGLPERHIKKTDPTGTHCLSTRDCCERPSPAHATCYRHQTFRTSELVTERLGVPRERWSVSFQSRLGRDPWLRPFTDLELVRLAREGVRKLVVMCPAFVSDCLETLEEVGIRGRQTFIDAGGEELRLVPCLNEDRRWIEALANLCRRAYGQTQAEPHTADTG